MCQCNSSDRILLPSEREQRSSHFPSEFHRTGAEVLLVEGRPSVAVGGMADGRRVVVGGDDDVVGVGFGDELYEKGIWV